ncbi:hypothetical protein Q9887_001101 [Vibrio fluvialis]|nr:hypothetical protein [Vibrio fluvialis]
MVYYHLSRPGLIKSKTLDLVVDQKHSHTHLWDDGSVSQYEFDGLSQHGRFYLSLIQRTGEISVENSTYHELRLEEIRKKHHSDKPSRFSSVFGCVSISDIQHIARECFKLVGIFPIYQIRTCNRAHESDMALTNPLFVHVADSRFNAYWSGYSEHSMGSVKEVLMETPVSIIGIAGWYMNFEINNEFRFF